MCLNQFPPGETKITTTAGLAVGSRQFLLPPLLIERVGTWPRESICSCDSKGRMPPALAKWAAGENFGPDHISMFVFDSVAKRQFVVFVGQNSQGTLSTEKNSFVGQISG